MKELLLLIALVIAIVLDLVRICQYVKMRNILKPKAKADTAERINKLFKKWVHNQVGMSIGEYIVNHLEDKD